MIRIKKILVPTDLKRQSLAGMKYAFSLARDHGAEVIFLHVVDEERITKSAMLPAEEELLFPRERVSIGEGSRRFIDVELRERSLDLYGFLYSHFEVQELRSVKITRLVRLGSVTEEIVSVAGEEQCDLIVMASRGKGWLARIFHGSMSEEVARRAPCPVLTIQPSVVVQVNDHRVPISSLVFKDAVSRL